MSTISWAELLTPDAPGVVVIAAPAADVAGTAADVSARRPRTVIRNLDAADCLTTPTFLRAFAAALEFPPGNVNWNVVEERLYDLTWFGDADAFVVVLSNCEQFTRSESPRDLAVVDSIFAGLAEDERTTPRRLVCQCDPGHLDEFAALLARHDLSWPEL